LSTAFSNDKEININPTRNLRLRV